MGNFVSPPADGICHGPDPPADVALSGLHGYPLGPKARSGSHNTKSGNSAIRTITTT